MIYIERLSPNPFQETRLYFNQIQKIKDWLINPNQSRPLLELPSFLLKRNETIRDNFYSAFNNKCAYCEIKLNQDEGQLSFFRPRVNALPNNSDSSNANYNYYYWWLSWEWTNLYLSCDECIRSKSNSFPVQNQRAEPDIYSLETLSSIEKPLLLDPCLDNPNEHLIFYENGTVSARNDSLRGSTTIDILDLKRDELIQARRNEADRLKDKFHDLILKIYNSHQQRSNIREIVNELRSECEADRLFAGMKRQLIFHWLKCLKNHTRDYIVEYYDSCSQSTQNNSKVEKEILTINSLMLISLQTEELPLNNLIIDLQNWLNQPNDNRIFTLDSQEDSDPTPEWLTNLFPNEEIIITLNSTVHFLERLGEEKIQQIKSIKDYLEELVAEDEVNLNDRNNQQILLDKLRKRYQESELKEFFNIFVNSPPGILDIKLWPENIVILGFNIINEVFGKNIISRLSVEFINSFDDENQQ